jgi:hypothetical protein
MVRDRPQWLCDRCRFELPGIGSEALYSRATSTRHFPAPIIVCGPACTSVAKIRLVAGLREASQRRDEVTPWVNSFEAMREVMGQAVYWRH